MNQFLYPVASQETKIPVSTDNFDYAKCYNDAEYGFNKNQAATIMDDATSLPLMPNCPECGEHRTVSSNGYVINPYTCSDCNKSFGRTKHHGLSNTLPEAPASDFKPGMPEDRFKEEFDKRFPTLCYEFMQTMNDIGMLGRNKYAENAVESRCKRGDYSRDPRIMRREIAEHARVHFQEFIDGVRHDVYGTTKHQLAAAAFNPMMEFLLSGLHEKETK